MDVLSKIDALAQQLNESIEERINLQKALFEVEDVTCIKQYELQNVKEALETGALPRRRGLAGVQHTRLAGPCQPRTWVCTRLPFCWGAGRHHHSAAAAAGPGGKHDT